MWFVELYSLVHYNNSVATSVDMIKNILKRNNEPYDYANIII